MVVEIFALSIVARPSDAILEGHTARRGNSAAWLK
jgi:hypothetical protein